MTRRGVGVAVAGGDTTTASKDLLSPSWRVASLLVEGATWSISHETPAIQSSTSCRLVLRLFWRGVIGKAVHSTTRFSLLSTFTVDTLPSTGRSGLFGVPMAARIYPCLELACTFHEYPSALSPIPPLSPNPLTVPTLATSTALLGMSTISAFRMLRHKLAKTMMSSSSQLTSCSPGELK